MRIFKDIDYVGQGNVAERLDLYLPEKESFPVFVYFHGGGIETGDKTDNVFFFEHLVAQGIAVVSANYRMYPFAVYPEFIRDAAAAVAWTKKHIGEYGSCEGLFVGGSSAGGYISMMLCFDHSYLAVHRIKPTDVMGYVHDAGQPTTHFNVLRERGLDPRRVIVDEAAPLYHVKVGQNYPPMLFIVSDNDMACRYEQTMLMLATLSHMGHSAEQHPHKLMHGKHCAYCRAADENGQSVFGALVAPFILENTKKDN
ncbi:MAG: alpha/beta hydrolase [Clostridia bacterium]|nr:alpha/beta hydrolase [Clostridia bacterium]